MGDPLEGTTRGAWRTSVRAVLLARHLPPPAPAAAGASARRNGRRHPHCGLAASHGAGRPATVAGSPPLVWCATLRRTTAARCPNARSPTPRVPRLTHRSRPYRPRPLAGFPRRHPPPLPQTLSTEQRPPLHVMSTPAWVTTACPGGSTAGSCPDAAECRTWRVSPPAVADPRAVHTALFPHLTWECSPDQTATALPQPRETQCAAYVRQQQRQLKKYTVATGECPSLHRETNDALAFARGANPPPLSLLLPPPTAPLPPPHPALSRQPGHRE